MAGVRLDSSGLGRFRKSLQEGGPPCGGRGVFRPDALPCGVGQTAVCPARAVAPTGASEPAAPAAAGRGGGRPLRTTVGRVCGGLGAPGAWKRTLRVAQSVELFRSLERVVFSTCYWNFNPVSLL